MNKQTYIHDVLEELPEEPKAAHTPEPLEVAPVYYYVNGAEAIDGYEVLDSNGNLVAFAKSEADARRVVACVNACRGLTNNILEACGKNDVALWIGTSDCSAAQNSFLKQQRDALLAVLKSAGNSIREAVTMSSVHNGHEYSFKYAIEKIDAAIAAVESGKVPS